MNLSEMMRRDWDERARRDAFHYIASWKSGWKLDDFLASGNKDCEELVSPALQRCGIALDGDVMLELGCGAGRMTPWFAERFRQVCAVDLSREMLQRARQIHEGRVNILWLLGNGRDLGCLASNSVDFAFSYLVLQHLPEEKLVLDYVGEMLRVLRPGGAFLFQFNGAFAPTMNWRGRMVWRTVDALWSMRLRSLSRAAAHWMGQDPEVAGRSWRGVAVPAKRIVQFVSERGGETREVTGENTPMTWCCGVKQAGA